MTVSGRKVPRPVGAIRSVRELERLVGECVQIYLVSFHGKLGFAEEISVEINETPGKLAGSVISFKASDGGKNAKEFKTAAATFGMDMCQPHNYAFMFSTGEAAARYAVRRKNQLNLAKENSK